MEAFFFVATILFSRKINRRKIISREINRNYTFCRKVPASLRKMLHGRKACFK